MRGSDVNRERPGNDRHGLRGPTALGHPPTADAGAENRHEHRHSDHAHLVLHGRRLAVEDVQHLAGHAHPRTTEPYEPRQRRIARDIARYRPGSTAGTRSGPR